MIHYIKGSNDLYHHKFLIRFTEFLIRNYGNQKTVEKHILNAERKELSPQNTMSSEIPFKEKGKIKTFIDKRKMKRIFHQQNCSIRNDKESSSSQR